MTIVCGQTIFVLVNIYVKACDVKIFAKCSSVCKHFGCNIGVKAESVPFFN